MLRRWMARLLPVLGFLVGALWAGTASAQEGCASCGGPAYACQRTHCPPPLIHCMERAPHIRWQCGCPKPICCPCDAPNWGYFQTCWTPWPWPPDWSHCPIQPPAAVVYPGQMTPQVVPLDNGAARKPGL